MENDFANMSDSEIDALYEQKIRGVETAPNFDEMTDAEVDRLYDEQVAAKYGDPSFLGELGSDALEILDTVDSYTGAPMREGLKTLGESESLLTAGKAFVNQFGEDTSTAATGKEVVRAAGVRDFKTLGGAYAAGNTPEEIQASLSEMPIEEQIAPANVPLEEGLGAVVEMTADPLMFIPVGKVLKYGGKGVSAVSKGTGRVVLNSSKTAQAVADGVDITNKTVRRTAKAIGDNLKNMFNPVQSADFPRMKKVLEKNDILPKNLEHIPESLEFGERSSISTASKVLRQDPLGEERTKVFNEFLLSVDGAIDTKIGGMADNVGADAFQGGEQLMKGYNDGVGELFDGAEVTYQNFNAIAPDHLLNEKSLFKLDNKLARIEKKATRLMKAGVGEERSKAKALLADIKAIRQGDGSYQGLVDTMQSVGRSAFKKKDLLERVPVDKHNLQDIYYTMRDIVHTEIAGVDPALAVKLKESNLKFNKFFSENEGISKVLSKAKDPQHVFNRLIANGNVTDLRALKSTMPAEAFNQVRATYLNTLIAREATYGNISYAKTITNMERRKRMIAEMFIDAPEALGEFQELLEVGKRTGDIILNKSGTDVSRRFRDFMGSILNSAISDATLEASKLSARGNAAKKAAAAANPYKVPRTKTSANDIQKGLSGARGLSRLLKDDEKQGKKAPKRGR